MIAKWHGQPFHDFKEKKWLVTFETEEIPEVYDSTSGKELSLTIKPYRKRRSLNANNYFWVLVTKIADVIGSTKEEVYETELRRHPIYEKEEDGYITVTMKDNVPVSRLGGHWMPIGRHGDFMSYAMLKGSSEYDTAEMAHLIDGVVEEAKELGIETMTPKEIEEMKAAWRSQG